MAMLKMISNHCIVEHSPWLAQNGFSLSYSQLFLAWQTELNYKPRYTISVKIANPSCMLLKSYSATEPASDSLTRI